MTALVGFNPGTVYSETDYVRGKCPNQNTTWLDPSTGKVFKFVKVAASQNLNSGHVVTLAPDSNGLLVATVAAASGAPESGVGAQAEIAVALATVTASVSQLIWCQVYGRCNVLASASCLPFTYLTIGAAAGTVDDALVTLSAIIDGIHLTASVGAASVITAAMLTYPKWSRIGD